MVEYMSFGLPVAAYDPHNARASAGDAGLYASISDEQALARLMRDRLAWPYSGPGLVAAYEQAYASRCRRRAPAPAQADNAA
jgi:hypothetical protein